MPRLIVIIDVDDVERGIRFYCDAFGLTVKRRYAPDFVELDGGDAPIQLLQKHAGTAPYPGAITTRDYERHWTPVHLDFVVDAIDAAVTRAIAAGARLEAPVSTHSYGRLALLSDPFGHGVCLVELTDIGYDALATG